MLKSKMFSDLTKRELLKFGIFISIAASVLLLVAFLIWDRREISKTVDLQRTRLEVTTNQLRFSNQNIAEMYNFDFLPQCNSSVKYLTDNSLSLTVDSLEKKIYFSKILEVLKLDKDHKVSRLVYSPKQVGTDIEFYKNISIAKETEHFSIKYDGPHNKARPLDFQVLVKNSSGQYCNQSMRLFFSKPVDKNWKVKSSIGRGGLNIGEFSLPYGTEFYKGRLWTTDCSNENVSVFELGGDFVDSFSRFGSAMGKFDTPADMKIFNEKIYVVEERNHRVQIFSLDGKPLFLFGSYKETSDPNLFVDKFNNPLGISVTEKLIVVVDYGNERILAYDHDFNHVWTSGNEEGDLFAWDNPYYIEYNPKHDHFLISNQTKSNIGILSPKGLKVGTFGSEVLATPFEVAVTPKGDVIVADTIKKQVVIFDGDDRYAVKHVIEFGEEFGIPKTVTAISDGRFLVGFVGNGPAYFLYLEQENNSEVEVEAVGIAPSFVVRDEAVQTIGLKDGPQNPRWVYSTFCASCHEGGIYNAPARGNVEEWERFPRDLDQLLFLAKRGKGAMIPKGGCAECSDDELRETIKLMLPRSWN